MRGARRGRSPGRRAGSERELSDDDVEVAAAVDDVEALRAVVMSMVQKSACSDVAIVLDDGSSVRTNSFLMEAWSSALGDFGREAAVTGEVRLPGVSREVGEAFIAYLHSGYVLPVLRVRVYGTGTSCVPQPSNLCVRKLGTLFRVLR